MAQRPRKPPPPDVEGAATREPLAVLIELVERVAACRGSEAYFSAAEVAAWPAGLVRALQTLNLLAAASPATSLECPGCEEACTMPVHVLPGPTPASSRAIIACDRRDDIGRVTVPLAALERQMSCGQQLAQAVVKVLGMTTARPVAIEGHAWRLGQYQGIKHKAELTLLLDTVPRLAIAGHTVPMAEVLGFKGGAVTVDQPALRKLVDNPTGTAGDGQETPSERAARIRKRVAELKASGARDSRKRVAQEEGIDVSRVGQILRAHPEPKATSNWFPDTALTKLPPPAKKRKA